MSYDASAALCILLSERNALSHPSQSRGISRNRQSCIFIFNNFVVAECSWALEKETGWRRATSLFNCCDSSLWKATSLQSLQETGIYITHATADPLGTVNWGLTWRNWISKINHGQAFECGSEIETNTSFDIITYANLQFRKGGESSPRWMILGKEGGRAHGWDGAITLKTAIFGFLLWRRRSLTVTLRHSLSLNMWLPVPRDSAVLSSYGQRSGTWRLTSFPGSSSPRVSWVAAV